jgi:hypothetical protein
LISLLLYDFFFPRGIGRIVRIEIHAKDRSPVTFANGDLPSRYKPTFFLKRSDKVTDFWKAHITRLNLTYAPPLQAAVLSLRKGQSIRSLRIDFFPTAGVSEATVLMKKTEGVNDDKFVGGGVGGTGPSKRKKKHKQQQQRADFPARPLTAATTTTEASQLKVAEPQSDAVSISSATAGAEPDDPLGYFRDVIGPRPVPELSWKPVAHAEWPENSIPTSSLVSSNTGGNMINVMLETGAGGKDIVLTESNPVTVFLEEVLEGPAVFVFLCDETKVAFHGQIEEI